LLPPLFLNRLDAIATNVDFVGIASLALYVAAMAALFRRPMSVLDVWLLVALSGFFAQMILNLASHDRFTVGFYFEYVLLVFATLVVLLALIDESNRLYVRLALATAARNREREARLVSIDAVAAAITDEVGQPLIATKLSASAGLSWLDRQKPDRSKAIESLRETIDAGDRTFEVIKRLRAALTSGSLSQFNLNDLVREAALLFERDLAAHKISLELALDDADLPMQGNRTKIQQVLSSLLANAIESVSAMPERARRVAIRSTLEGEKILLDISDTGVGILREKIDKIFDPFFTLSASGTGLGLSLARTIIEEHGGRLSVSSDKDRGTTFHLQMNCCRVAGKLHSSSSILEDAQVAVRPLTPVELNVFRDEAADLLTLISSELAALREAGHDQAWLRRSMELLAGIERKLSSLV